MNKSLATVVASFAVVALLQPAYSGTLQFHANITHDQEVGVPNEGSSGVGDFVYTFVGSDPNSGAAVSLSYDVTLSGLDLDGNQTPANANDNVTRTHFHNAPAGSNGGIVFGQIDPSSSLQNDLDDLSVNPAAGKITGVWDGTEGNATTLEAQKASLLAGNLYFNVHTADHAGGEVRGQVLLVPEPTSMGLCLIAGAALGIRRRRREV